MAGLRRIDPSGELRVIHIVHAENPAVGIKRMLGQGLVGMGAVGAFLLKVNRLHVEENGRQTRCSAHAEVIEFEGERPIRRFETGITVVGDRCKDDTACLQELVRTTVTAFFSAFERARTAGELISKELTVDEMRDPFAPDASNSLLLNRSVPKRGLYRTFMDMRMDRPDTLYDFEIRESVRSLGGMQMVKLKNVPDAVEELYWGLSSGTHSYVRVGHEFHRLDRQGSEFTTSVPQPSSTDPAAVMIGGLFFGSLGAGLVAATTTTPSPPILFDLDLLCGDLIPHDRSRETDTYSQQVFYVTRFAKSETPINIRWEGLDPRSIGQNQWTAFQPTPRATPSRVILSNGHSEEILDVDTNSDRVNVHLIDVKKDGTITVDKLKEQMRISVINDLKADDRR